MFKKKSNLPPRPKYPSTDQMIADLLLITNDDSLFATSKMILEKKPKMDGSQEQDVVYEKVKKFFNLHEELHENMKNLGLLVKSLKERENEVILLSEQLKDQTLKALS